MNIENISYLRPQSPYGIELIKY